MDNVIAITLVCFVNFAFGIVVGAGASEITVNNNCEKYSQYATDKYKLTCEKK